MLRIATKIKIELLKKGITSSEVARRANVHRSYVSHVIAGRFKGEKIRRVIAQALGKRVEELWPKNKKRKAV